MDKPKANLEPPRFENRNAFLIAGTTARYNNQRVEGIPAQWQKFMPYIGKVPGQVGTTSYGVCFNFDDAGNMDYMCGVEVPEGTALPPELGLLAIPEHRWAVFVHRDHISKIKATWRAIFGQWMPASGYKPARGPQLEAYVGNFNPQTGHGEVEIWIPITQ